MDLIEGMRACICLRGNHYLQLHDYKTDFRTSVDNYNSHLISSLVDMGYSVDIMCLTYNTGVIDELQMKYNPVRMDVLPASERTCGNSWNRQCIFHMRSKELIESYETEMKFKYDLIINLRFDILFLKYMKDLPLDLNKMNIVNKNMFLNCDDNLFIFPRNCLDDFSNAFKLLLERKKITHEFNHVYTGPIHYMVNEIIKENSSAWLGGNVFKINRYQKV